MPDADSILRNAPPNKKMLLCSILDLIQLVAQSEFNNVYKPEKLRFSVDFKKYEGIQ